MNKKSGADWWAIGIFVLLVVFGWLNLLSASYGGEGTWSWGNRYGVQLFWIGVSGVVALVLLWLPALYYHAVGYWFYGLMILALLATLAVGTEVNGAKSWLRIAGFGIQPVEFAKVATALALARFMSEFNFRFSHPRDLIISIGIVTLPMLIVVLQNDVGSAIVFLSFLIAFYREGLNKWVYIVVGMGVIIAVLSFFVERTPLLILIAFTCCIIEGLLSREWKTKTRYAASIAIASIFLWVGLYLIGYSLEYYYCLFITLLVSLPIIIIYAYRNKLRSIIACAILFVGSFLFMNGVEYAFNKVLQPYQQKRILILFGIESDPQNLGYNINQSKIAIGSGGFAGRGYMEGTQTKYDFIPEQSTDFIFCTVGEEWGFLGSAAVLLLFVALIFRLLRMGERQSEHFGRVYCYSVAGIIFAHVFINVGMVTGILPVIGIPLPLFSYGGSSLLAFTILFFIAVRLDAKRTIA